MLRALGDQPHATGVLDVHTLISGATNVTQLQLARQHHDLTAEKARLDEERCYLDREVLHVHAYVDERVAHIDQQLQHDWFTEPLANHQPPKAIADVLQRHCMQQPSAVRAGLAKAMQQRIEDYQELARRLRSKNATFLLTHGTSLADRLTAVATAPASAESEEEEQQHSSDDQGPPVADLANDFQVLESGVQDELYGQYIDSDDSDA